MHVLVTGGTGLIGRVLVDRLIVDGHRVTVLSRRFRADVGDVAYVQALAEIGSYIDAVINLAGAGLADRRWTERYKHEIVASRIGLTDELVEYFDSRVPPKVFISGSAIGFYGHDLEREFTEESDQGTGFSAELCAGWEASARQLESEATRCVYLRTGVVLEKKGGAYPQMTQSWNLGVASWMGDGEHWLSWIHIDDMVGGICFCLERSDATGALNMTAPSAVTHRDFAHTVSQKRKALISLGMPATLMRVLLGQMADELLLNGQKVLPNELASLGYTFKFPTLEEAVEHLER